MGIRLFSYFEMIKGAASFASKQAANVDCPRPGVKSTVCYFSLLCNPVKTHFYFLALRHQRNSLLEGRSETKRQAAYLHFAFNLCYKDEYRQTKCKADRFAY